MTLLNNVKNEFQNSPMAASYAVIGIVGIIITSIGFGTSPTIIKMNGNQDVVILFNVNHLLICMAYYIFASLLGISVIRLLSRYSDFTATLLSVATAVLINFSTYIIINFLPPTTLNGFQILKVSNVIYWSTLVLFVAFFSKAVISSLIISLDKAKVTTTESNEENNSKNSKSNNSVNSSLLLFIACLLIWGKMVSYGQHSLIFSLLPEAWQPIPEEKTVKSK